MAAWVTPGLINQQILKTIVFCIVSVQKLILVLGVQEDPRIVSALFSAFITLLLIQKEEMNIILENMNATLLKEME